MNSFAVERFFCHTSRVCWLFWVWASWYSLFERKSRFEGNCHNMTRNRLNMAQPSTLTINQYIKVSQLQCQFYVKILIFSFTQLHYSSLQAMTKQEWIRRALSQCDLQKPGRWEPWKPMQRNTDKKIGGKIRLKEKDIYDIIWYDML